MKLNKVKVCFSHYDPYTEEQKPEWWEEFNEEDMEGFKKAKQTLSAYLTSLILQKGRVHKEAKVTITEMMISMTIHNPPTPDLGEVTVEIKGLEWTDGSECLLKDHNGETILNLSDTYNDVSWRELNRIVDKMLKINA